MYNLRVSYSVFRMFWWYSTQYLADIFDRRNIWVSQPLSYIFRLFVVGILGSTSSLFVYLFSKLWAWEYSIVHANKWQIRLISIFHFFTEYLLVFVECSCCIQGFSILGIVDFLNWVWCSIEKSSTVMKYDEFFTSDDKNHLESYQSLPELNIKWHIYYKFVFYSWNLWYS